MRSPRAALSAAHSEAESVALGQPARTLKAVLPQFARAAGQRAAAAAGRLSTLHAALGDAGKNLADGQARRDHDLSRFQSSETLTRLKRKLLWREKLLVLAEAVAVSLAIASFLGLTDNYGGAAPLSAWLSGASLAASAVLSGWGLAWIGAKLLGTGPLPKRLGLIAGLGLGAASLAFAAAIGFVRYAGADSRLSSGAAAAGSVGLAIIVSLCSAVVFTTCLITRRQLLFVEAELSEVTKRSDAHGREISRLTIARDEAAEREAGATRESGIVDELETAFEAAVQLIAGKLRAYNAILPDRLARAVSAWRTLKDLSAPELEMVAATAFRLVPVDEKTGGKTGILSVLRTLTMLLLVLGATSFFACTDHRPPAAVTLICDPSGKAPEDVCSPLLLSLAYQHFIQVGPPLNSRFTIIYTGRSLSATVTAPALVVLPRSRADRDAWIDRTVTALGSETLPNLPADGKDNVSDLLSALVIASEDASAFPADRHSLFIASDGLLVSRELGLNAERHVPSTQEVLARLREKHIRLDLSLFTGRLTICGFSNAGLTASALEARAELWRELIASSQGGTPIILPTCRGLYQDTVLNRRVP